MVPDRIGAWGWKQFIRLHEPAALGGAFKVGLHSHPSPPRSLLMASSGTTGIYITGLGFLNKHVVVDMQSDCVQLLSSLFAPHDPPAGCRLFMGTVRFVPGVALSEYMVENGSRVTLMGTLRGGGGGSIPSIGFCRKSHSPEGVGAAATPWEQGSKHEAHHKTKKSLDELQKAGMLTAEECLAELEALTGKRKKTVGTKKPPPPGPPPPALLLQQAEKLIDKAMKLQFMAESVEGETMVPDTQEDGEMAEPGAYAKPDDQEDSEMAKPDYQEDSEMAKPDYQEDGETAEPGAYAKPDIQEEPQDGTMSPLSKYMQRKRAEKLAQDIAEGKSSSSC